MNMYTVARRSRINHEPGRRVRVPEHLELTLIEEFR